MKRSNPSTCPVALSLDALGDKWSLVILRDILLAGKCHFRELLDSPEKIASNVLSARLDSLTREGFLSKHPDPANKSAAIYKPTAKALDLLPMLFELIRWGVAHNERADSTHPGIRQILDNPTATRAQIASKFRH